MPTVPARVTPHRRTLAAAVLLGLAPFAANAATIVVGSPDDPTPTATTTCTLRQAILSVNAAAPIGGCTNSSADAFGTNDTITFAASALTGGTTAGTITLADSADTSGAVGGTLVIDASVNALVIDGSAWRGNGSGQFPGGVTIARSATATHAFGLLSAGHAPGTSETSALTLNGLTLTGGKSQGASVFGADISCGGAIATTYVDLTLVDSTVTGNSAGSMINGGTNGFGGGIFGAFGVLKLVRSTVDDNHSLMPANSQSASVGGGVASIYGSLVVIDSTLTGNSALMGGGAATNAGPLTMERSTVSGNVAAMVGGGLYPGGGGTLIDSTISGNSSAGGGGIGAISATMTLNVVNSTLAGNQVTQTGGAIYLPSNSTLALTHATISRNTVSPVNSTGTGGAIAGRGTATALNSIVADNLQALGGDVALTGSGTWTPTDSILSDVGLNLGNLADNGGPTQTMLPGIGSTAINAVACLASVTADQRGMPRPDPAGAGLATPCDIGAVETGSILDRIFANGFEAGTMP